MNAYIKILIFTCIIQLEFICALTITGNATISINNAKMSMKLVEIKDGCNLTLQATTGKFLDTISLVKIEDHSAVLQSEEQTELAGKALYKYVSGIGAEKFQSKITAKICSDGSQYEETDLKNILDIEDEKDLSEYVDGIVPADKNNLAIIMDSPVVLNSGSKLGNYNISDAVLPVSFISSSGSAGDIINLKIIDTGISSLLEFLGKNRFYRGETSIALSAQKSVIHKNNSMFGGKVTYTNATVNVNEDNAIGGDIILDNSILKNNSTILLMKDVTIDCSNSIDDFVLLGCLSGVNSSGNIANKLTIKSSINDKKIYVNKMVDKCFLTFDGTSFKITDYVAIADVRFIDRQFVKDLVTNFGLSSDDVIYAPISNLVYAKTDANTYLTIAAPLNVSFEKKVALEPGEYKDLADILTQDSKTKYFVLHKSGIIVGINKLYATDDKYVFETDLDSINLGFISDTKTSNNSYAVEMSLKASGTEVTIYGKNEYNSSTYSISSVDNIKTIKFQADKLSDITLEYSGNALLEVFQ